MRDADERYAYRHIHTNNTYFQPIDQYASHRHIRTRIRNTYTDADSQRQRQGQRQEKYEDQFGLKRESSRERVIYTSVRTSI